MRAAVARLLAEGLSRAEVARRLGVTRPTVTYHAKKLGEPIDIRCNRRYDWAAVQTFYDAGHSITDCQLRFGMSRKSFTDAVARGAVVTRPRAMSIEDLLVGPRNRKHIKGRLIGAGLKRDECELCGLTSWRAAPISVQLHHLNGDPDDHRLENLQLLCPNCHSQTDNFCGRKRRRPDGGADPQAAA